MLRRLGLVAAIAGLMALTMISTGAEAGKPQVQLSYQLYSFDDGSHKVEYTVKKGSGSADLAVHHQCFSDGTLVADRMNRVYWSGRGADRTGNWIASVNAGDSCSAVVIDVSQPMTGESLSAASGGYMAVSSPVRYVVE